MRIARWGSAAVLAALALSACSGARESTDPDPSTGASSTASAVPTAASPALSARAAPSAEPAALAWAELDAPGPAAREDHTWTVAPGGLAYLFGGRDVGTVHGDLWAYDLAADAWSEVDAGAGPPARFGHEAVWVDEVGLVIFAGQAGATFFNDLWAFDPATTSWRQLRSTGDVPVPRYGTCAAVGPDGRLWISHGFTSDGARFADTRAYDFGAGTWSDETPSGTLPIERCLHGCWWTDADELVLYGGQTTGVTALGDRWILAPDGGWTRADPTGPQARNLAALVRLDGATLVFGGQGSDQGFLADAWLLADGASDAAPIEPVAGGRAPGGRSGATLISDAERDRVLLFGGRDAGGAFDDTWQLEGLAPAG